MFVATMSSRPNFLFLWADGMKCIARSRSFADIWTDSGKQSREASAFS